MRVEENLTVLDAINQVYLASEKEAFVAYNHKDVSPHSWATVLRFSDLKENSIYTLRIQGLWAIFKGRLECHLYNGSYCFNNNSYLGEMGTPPIDTLEFHPGEDFWEEVTCSETLPTANVIMIFQGPDVKMTLMDNLKGKKF